LLLSILGATKLSPWNPYSQITPTVFVLLVAILREGIEDYFRYKLDTETNKMQVMKVIDNRSSIYADSFSIKVGDTIRISDGKEVPADVIIINSSNPEGNCFIQTSSLDGEKNLKKRCVSKGLKLHDTIFIQGLIECDPPNSELYEFRGQLTLENDPKRYVLNEN
jgi:magnesium-transporting ATPase (P-type)